jgi:H+-transporting ATPase
VAVLIVGFGFLMTPLPWSYIGLIWIYCLIWVFIEDWAKINVYHHLNLNKPHHRSFLQRIKSSAHSGG